MSDPKGELAQVLWQDGNWGFLMKPLKGSLYRALSSYLDVIGNIYENPELLAK